MKANELRIGNFINDCQFKKPLKVSIGVLEEIENNMDFYEPIQLTQEWLVRFGFKTRTTISHSIQFFIGENPITHDWIFDILWINGDDHPFYRNGHFKIKYVHQLQNLYFALTGEELELKQD